MSLCAPSINNDQKISTIGQYIRSRLICNVHEPSQAPDAQFFGWELAPRLEPHRLRRKLLQLVVNEALFVGSGLIALAVFFILGPRPTTAWWIAGIEVLALAVLAVEIVRYADIRRR